MTLQQAQLHNQRTHHVMGHQKNWLSTEKRKNEYLENIIYGDYEDLKIEHQLLRQEYDKVILQLSAVTDSNEKLKAQLNRDHDNSSIPSSKERFPKKVKNSRVKTDRKPGA